MLIVCPACASEYEIEGDYLGPQGRSVRCAGCGETWFVTADAPPEEVTADTESMLEASPSEAEAEPESEPAPELAVAESAPAIEAPAPRPRKSKPRKRAALPVPRLRRRLPFSPALAAGLALLALVPLGLVGRAGVVRAMPRSAGLFSAIGLPVNLRGIDLADVVATRSPAAGNEPAKLRVEGMLRSVSSNAVSVPALTVELHDGHGETIQSWVVPAPRSSLEPDESARFQASLPAPPAQGVGVLVRFADATTAEPAEPGERHAEESHDPHPEPAPAPAHGGDSHHGGH